MNRESGDLPGLTSRRSSRVKKVRGPSSRQVRKPPLPFNETRGRFFCFTPPRLHIPAVLVFRAFWCPGRIDAPAPVSLSPCQHPTREVPGPPVVQAPTREVWRVSSHGRISDTGRVCLTPGSSLTRRAQDHRGLEDPVPRVPDTLRKARRVQTFRRYTDVPPFFSNFQLSKM